MYDFGYFFTGYLYEFFTIQHLLAILRDRGYHENRFELLEFEFQPSYPWESLALDICTLDSLIIEQEILYQMHICLSLPQLLSIHDIVLKRLSITRLDCRVYDRRFFVAFIIINYKTICVSVEYSNQRNLSISIFCFAFVP